MTLSNLAKKLNISTHILSQYLNDNLDKSFSLFINELRIEKACKLLLNKSHSIIEVSEKSGFINVSNFNRKFKELKNKTTILFINFG